MALSKVRGTVEKLFGKHLLATNIVTCGTLLGVGDFVVQRSNMAYEKYHKINANPKYDFARTGRMITIGFVLGPFNHFWYSFLDKVLKGTGGTIVFKKIAADQAVAGPFFCTSFLFGMGILEGKGFSGAAAEWKDKFISIYIVDWAFWPMAQFINFRYLPSRFRVLYVSSATLLWNSFLSYMKHKEDSEWQLYIKEIRLTIEKASLGRGS